MSKFLRIYQHENYLNLRQTEEAIKVIKDNFEVILSNCLHLTRVSAPLFVTSDSGLNDNLNGIETPVQFIIPDMEDAQAEIVHSLAKWKRFTLTRYYFSVGEGIYTDMNAIRKDEELDNLHSLYVDQWDWELIIHKQQRSIDYLKEVVTKLYDALKQTERILLEKYPFLPKQTVDNITFITTQELENRYPMLTPKEREDAITKEYKAVFLIQIGKKLISGNRHDGRSPDYDDWELNGDILVWSSVFERAIELSSMGIRVDEESLVKQLQELHCENRLQFPFHQALLHGELPYTIGGGIGQSRLCLYLLSKRHIGEVQASLWDDDTALECRQENITLL